MLRRALGIPARPRGWNLRTGQRDANGRVTHQAIDDGLTPPPAADKRPRARKPRSTVPFDISDTDRVRLELRDRRRRTKAGVAPVDDLPTIAGVNALSLATRYIDGGRERFVELVQLAVIENHPAATNWWEVYRDLTAYQRTIVSFDDVCAASGVKPSQLMSVVVTVAMELGRDVGNLVAALTHPEIVAKLAESAKRIDGEFADIAHKDRLSFLQAQGYMPVPKSHVINVNASASAQAAAAAAQEPSVPGFAADISQARHVGGGSTTLALPAADAALDPFTQVLQGATAEPQLVLVDAVPRDLDGR